MTSDSAKLRDTALQHYKAGRFADAVKLQVQVVNAVGGLRSESVDDQKRLAAFLFSAGDHASTAAVMGPALSDTARIIARACDFSFTAPTAPERALIETARDHLNSLIERRPERVIRAVMRSIKRGENLPATPALIEETRLFCELSMRISKTG